MKSIVWLWPEKRKYETRPTATCFYSSWWCPKVDAGCSCSSWASFAAPYKWLLQASGWTGEEEHGFAKPQHLGCHHDYSDLFGELEHIPSGNLEHVRRTLLIPGVLQFLDQWQLQDSNCWWHNKMWMIVTQSSTSAGKNSKKTCSSCGKRRNVLLSLRKLSRCLTTNGLAQESDPLRFGENKRLFHHYGE